MTRFVRGCVWLGLLLALLVPAAPAGAEMGDAADLQGYRWPEMRKAFLGGGEVAYDGITLVVPVFGENSAAVPVTIQTDPALGAVREILVVADYNPYPLIVRMFPNARVQEISLRTRMERSSPIRVAARTADGIWHVAAKLVQVKGGGCSAGGGEALAKNQRQGDLNVVAWGRPEGSRIRLQLIHPMDTGLARDEHGELIPLRYVTLIDIRSASRSLIRIEPSPPISANPTFTVSLEVTPQELAELNVVATDTREQRYVSEDVTLFMDPSLTAPTLHVQN